MKVLACIQWNEQTQVCDVQAWVEQPSLLEVMPTMEQAQEVGLAVFIAWVTVAALKYLLKPTRETSNEP